MKRSKNLFASLGLLGGLAAMIAIFRVGDTYGLPGTDAYRTYENFNRWMSLFLGLQVFAIINFYIYFQDRFAKSWRILFRLIVIGWLGMAVGTATEFFLFSDLPYGENNLRNTAFTLYSISGLLTGLSSLIVGVRILTRGEVSRIYGIIFILFLPLDIGLFISGGSIFLATAIISSAFAILLLTTNSSPSVLEHPNNDLQG